MASEKKKRKLKNSYCSHGALKNKLPHRCKRLLFYTSSQRKDYNSKIDEELLEYCTIDVKATMEMFKNAPKTPQYKGFGESKHHSEKSEVITDKRITGETK